MNLTNGVIVKTNWYNPVWYQTQEKSQNYLPSLITKLWLCILYVVSLIFFDWIEEPDAIAYQLENCPLPDCLDLHKLSKTSLIF